MKKTVRTIAIYIFAAVLAVFCLFTTAANSFLYARAAAYAAELTGFDSTNVLDDLEGSTIAGKEFNLADYPFNSESKPQIIAFAEYGYSYSSERQSDYGLYVYIYNPQGLAFDTDTDRNKIELAYDGQDNWTKYELEFLNYSTRAGYEGLFYKFRLELTDTQKSNILTLLDSTARIYEISGIELSVGNTVTDYTVAMRYTYSGYAEGYGSELATSDSLSCEVDGFEEYLTLDVHTTYYRPEGTNGNSDYTQDTLHSVYFSVPKETVEEYGTLSAIHATWLDAVLKPALVTGNEDAYNAIQKYLGKSIGYHTDELDYIYACIDTSAGNGGVGTYTIYDGLYSYNLPRSWASNRGYAYSNECQTIIDTLYLLFYAPGGINSADDYTVSSEDIEKALIEGTELYGGSLINGRYSSVLFDSVASDFTDIEIPADFEFDLENQVIGSSWWDKFLGTTYSEAYNDIKAIQSVSDDDFIYNDGQIDVAATCDNLFISEYDFDDFRKFYEQNEADNVIYLFRYQVNEYTATEAGRFEYDDSFWVGGSYEIEDTNAFFFQQKINLDFDIIDVTFTKDGESTVIPAVADPKDNIPDATPPVYTHPDGVPWLTIVLLLAVSIGGIVVTRIVKHYAKKTK